MARPGYMPNTEFELGNGSPEWKNNVEVINEVTTADRMEFAQVIATMEVSRQLDRIANALERRNKADLR